MKRRRKRKLKRAVLPPLRPRPSWADEPIRVPHQPHVAPLTYSIVSVSLVAAMMVVAFAAPQWRRAEPFKGPLVKIEKSQDRIAYWRGEP